MKTTLEILKDLVSIPSYVDEASDESKLIQYIVEFFNSEKMKKYKIEKQLVEGSRYNLYIHDEVPTKVLLFGHMDTVQSKLETTAPYEANIQEGRLYGLGSVDMKAGIAICLDIMQKSEYSGLGLLLTVDEEYEFKGAKKLVDMPKISAELIINVEPTDCKIYNGCRGVTEFSYSVHGKSAHAGRKEFGINAIESAVRLNDRLQEIITMYDLPGGGKNSLNLSYLHGGVLRESSNDSELPKVSGIGNVVPNYASVVTEIRVANKEVTKDFIQNKIDEIASELGIQIKDLTFKFYLGPLLTPKEKLKDFEGSFEGTNVSPEYADINASGYFEVQMLKEYWNLDSVIFGPGPGSKAHMADEYVDIETVGTAQRVIENYLSRVLN